MLRRKAFTLIELLIVVAIIAILAAIAVPNFLEAQMRSKISRTKADMRSMMLAAESYRIDNNKYMSDNIKIGGKVGPDVMSWYLLTTPIAYMSSIPQSPFKEYKNIKHGYGITYATGQTDGNNGDYMEYWNGNFSGPGGSYQMDANAVRYNMHYRASSNGPDSLSDFHNQYKTGSFSVLSIVTRDPKFVDCIYDATNGTTSRGDIFISNQGFIQ